MMHDWLAAARLPCRHSPELAQAVIDSGALDSLVTCLEEFDPGVKEAATWCLGYIAGHNAELAQQVVDAGEGGRWQHQLCHGHFHRHSQRHILYLEVPCAFTIVSAALKMSLYTPIV
jgi:hypothetical protein